MSRGLDVGASRALFFRCQDSSTCVTIRGMTKPSGKTQIRIHPSLHAHLIKIAEQEGKSLNSLIEVLLAGGSNFKLPKK